MTDVFQLRDEYMIFAIMTVMKSTCQPYASNRQRDEAFAGQATP